MLGKTQLTLVTVKAVLEIVLNHSRGETRAGKVILSLRSDSNS